MALIFSLAHLKKINDLSDRMLFYFKSLENSVEKHKDGPLKLLVEYEATMVGLGIHNGSPDKME